MVALLGEWYVAAALGLVLGVALMLVSLRAARLVTPDDPAFGFARVALIMVLRLVVVLGALFAYFFFARPGIVPFGVALVVSFIASIGLEAARLARTTASPR